MTSYTPPSGDMAGSSEERKILAVDLDPEVQKLLLREARERIEHGFSQAQKVVTFPYLTLP